MSILMLSDAHLHGLDDPGQRDLLGFLGAVDFEELVIVGDLFDVWWAIDGSVPIDAVPVLAAFHERVGAGVPVTWIAGNHDWAPGVSELGITVAPSWTREVGGRRMLAVHGDRGVDPSLRNRSMYRALRSRSVQRVGRALGTQRVRTLGRVLSGWSRRQSGGPEAGLRRQLRLADQLLERTADVVFVGHTHCPGRLERPSGQLVNLGDWVEHRSYARVSEAGVELYRWTGEETPIPAGPPQRWPWVG